MNPMDDVSARIQAIEQRIQQIRNLSQAPPGQAKSTGTTAASGTTGTQSGTGSQGATTAASSRDTVQSPEFQQLLQQALALGADSSTASSDQLDSTLGSIDSAVSSLLGGTPSQLGGSGDASSSTRLQEYQNMLLDALRQIQAKSGK